MAMALALQRQGELLRDFFLYDTFEGMPAPTPVDRDFRGHMASRVFERRRLGQGSDWCRASLEDVRRNVLSTGYAENQFTFVAGKVEATIPAKVPEQIALLRLDTDWYESTKHEMEHLYPRLVPGGVLIVDDYGHWGGARQAIDEYLAAHGIELLLQPIDYTGRIAVKI